MGVGAEDSGTSVEAAGRRRVEEIVHEYVDPVLGVKGWVTFSGTAQSLAVGGCRVEAGLTSATLVELARVMRLKESILGLPIDGAKAGLDYPPDGPHMFQVLRRFISFLSPHLAERFSMGPDAGTSWQMLERCAQEQGLLSIKMAIARAQGLAENDFLRRLKVLTAPVSGMPLSERRAGHGLAAAVSSAARRLDVTHTLRVAIQGFGTLSRGALFSLSQTGCRVVAVADEHACVIDEDGLDVATLLSLPPRAPISQAGCGDLAQRSAVFGVPTDTLILAACGDALTSTEVGALSARCIAVGANMGLSEEAEHAAMAKGIVVIPDFVAGAGGSASMDALFGPPKCPSADAVLQRTSERIQEVVTDLLHSALAHNISPRLAGLALCRQQEASGGKPYGRTSSTRS